MMCLTQYLSRVGANNCCEVAYAEVRYCADQLARMGYVEAASVLLASLDPTSGFFDVPEEFRERCCEVEDYALSSPVVLAVLDQATEAVRQAMVRDGEGG